MTEHSGNTSMFGIFILTISTIALLTYTAYHFCGEADEEAAAAWAEKVRRLLATQQLHRAQNKKKKPSLGATLKRYATKGNLTVLALWIGWLLLLWWVSASIADDAPFDPFEILELSHGATDREIKKAYRTLSLKYHPDKNPDPKAAAYFAEYITKAYQALTDEVSRRNWEKYGHPDGPQAMNLGIALPEWIFPKDKNMAPLVLIGLVVCCIIVPLVSVAFYMMRSNRYTGPNNIMHETLAFYYQSRHAIKESQSLVRIPETLVCAWEFITLKTPSDHSAAIEELGKIVKRSNPDLKEKPLFWRRRPPVLKCHMLLIAYLDREPAIPDKLAADFKFVLQKTPLLLEEMLKIAAAIPRAPHGHAWLTPSLAVVEMMQCVAQAEAIAVRKPQSGKPSDVSVAALQQLPGVDGDVVKKLKRKNIRSVADLAELGEPERLDALKQAGVIDELAESASLLALTLPTLHVNVKVTGPDGDDQGIMEGDPVVCSLSVALSRAAHRDPDYSMPAASKAPKAVTPLLPNAPKEEAWHLFVADASTNSVLAWVRIHLVEAEAYALQHPEQLADWEKVAGAVAGSLPASAEPNKDDGAEASTELQAAEGKGKKAKKDKKKKGPGQTVDIGFQAPMRVGKYDLTIILMSESYIGCDRTVLVRVKIAQRTRAAEEGRDARAKEKLKQWQDSDDEEGEASRNKGDDDDDGSDGDDEEDDESGSNDDYDSDETGELETEDEDEGTAAESKPDRSPASSPGAGNKDGASSEEPKKDK